MHMRNQSYPGLWHPACIRQQHHNHRVLSLVTGGWPCGPGCSCVCRMTTDRCLGTSCFVPSFTERARSWSTHGEFQLGCRQRCLVVSCLLSPGTARHLRCPSCFGPWRGLLLSCSHDTAASICCPSGVVLVVQAAAAAMFGRRHTAVAATWSASAASPRPALLAAAAPAEQRTP